MKKEEEIWKPIPGYEKEYEVSSLGRVKTIERTKKCGKNLKSLRTYKSRIRRLGSNPNGYAIIALCKNGKTKHFAVHRIVAAAFIQNPNGLATVNHKNGLKKDNRVSNLEWLSQSDQLKHAHKMGLIDQRGVRNPASKLDENDLLLFEALISTGYMNIEIAEIFGVSKSTVCNVKSGKHHVLPSMRL